MKILLSAYACEPNRGSEPGAGWNWAYYLAKEGHSIYLFTRIHGRSAIEQELALHPLPNLNVTYIDLPDWSKKMLHGQLGIYLHYLLWQEAAFKKASSLVKSQKIDLVHHVTWSSLRGGSLLWKLSKPFVFGPIGGGQLTPKAFASVMGAGWQQENFRNFSNQLISYYPPVQNLLKHSTALLATNQETQNLALRGGAKRTELFLDSGLPVDYIPEAIPERSPCAYLRVLWVGRLYWIKGLPLALQAIQRTKAPVKLTIVGGGPLADHLKEWIKSSHLENKVDWWGQVPWPQVKQAYMDNDVFLFTSLRDSFGAQLLEAMAHGLPVLTLDHHGARDFVPPEASIKVPVTTPEETVENLALGIEKLWQNPQERKEMGSTAYQFAQSHTWNKKSQKMTEIYQSLLKNE